MEVPDLEDADEVSAVEFVIQIDIAEVGVGVRVHLEIPFKLINETIVEHHC